jgi:hypothetical protein
MTQQDARGSIGQQIFSTTGISQPRGPFLPAGSTFRLEFIEGRMFGLSWPSPRGQLSLQLPLSALDNFISKADWFR